MRVYVRLLLNRWRASRIRSPLRLGLLCYHPCLGLSMKLSTNMSADRGCPKAVPQMLQPTEPVHDSAPPTGSEFWTSSISIAGLQQVLGQHQEAEQPAANSRGLC